MPAPLSTEALFLSMWLNIPYADSEPFCHTSPSHLLVQTRRWKCSAGGRCRGSRASLLSLTQPPALFLTTSLLAKSTATTTCSDTPALLCRPTLQLEVPGFPDSQVPIWAPRPGWLSQRRVDDLSLSLSFSSQTLTSPSSPTIQFFFLQENPLSHNTQSGLAPLTEPCLTYWMEVKQKQESFLFTYMPRC